MRASMLAGAAIVLVAGVVLALIALAGRSPRREPALPAHAAATLDAGAPAQVRAETTVNLYAGPERTAEVVAVLPSGQLATALGRTSDTQWVQVSYPPGSATRGWARASGLTGGTLAALPVLAVSAPTRPPEEPRPAARALPDLAIADAFLLQGEKLAVGIRNLGAAALTEAMVALNVTRVEGDVIGVLRIGPTTLAPGAGATVVTPLSISEGGSYRLELDPANEIAEAQESNNSYTGLLVPNRG